MGLETMPSNPSGFLSSRSALKPPYSDLVYEPNVQGQIWIMDNIRPTSHAATAHPAPVKKPTQNQTPIRYRLTVEGILDFSR